MKLHVSREGYLEACQMEHAISQESYEKLQKSIAKCQGCSFKSNRRQ